MAVTASPEADRQREVLAFLARPEAHGAGVHAVETIETHAAIVFLAGERALKVKKAVDLGYLDFSTLERRRRACEREVAINQPHAPGIYLGVVAITRERNGRLRIDGGGEAVEHAVLMRRFAQEDLLEAVAGQGPLPEMLARGAGLLIADYHAAAEPVGPDEAEGARRISATANRITARLRTAVDATAAAAAAALCGRLDALAADPFLLDLLDARGRQGFVRRCHGDLHLSNIVVIDGALVPFDAIEFDEELATVDVLYDLAFLLMDLLRLGDRRAANIVLNRYLLRSGDDRHLDGLAALPLFLALRAGIRGLVLLDRAMQLAGDRRASLLEEAGHRIGLATALVEPAMPRLVAVGGYSGTGKSTLSAALAPGLGAAPGAIHLRSDLERKMMLGAAETERLPETAYARAVSAEVYSTMLGKAARALAAGHCVVLDAVFAAEEERSEARALAQRIGCRFDGLWLTAEKDVLMGRVADRRGDASDATASIVESQVARGAGPVDWKMIAAGGPPDQVHGEARLALGL